MTHWSNPIFWDVLMGITALISGFMGVRNVLPNERALARLLVCLSAPGFVALTLSILGVEDWLLAVIGLLCFLALAALWRAFPNTERPARHLTSI